MLSPISSNTPCKSVTGTEFRSDVIDHGNPWMRTISLKNKFDMALASLVFLHAKKCAILDNLSTTTKTKSLLRCVLGRPSTKSMEMSLQGSSGVGSVPCYSFVNLANWTTFHMLGSAPLQTRPIIPIFHQLNRFILAKMSAQPPTMDFIK